MKKYRIGLLLDSFFVRSWQYHIIDFIEKHPAFQIDVVIINDAKKNTKRDPSYWIYKLFMRVDRKVFKTSTDLFKIRAVPDYLKSRRVIHTVPRQTKTADEILEADLSIIRECNLDILLRFGFRILKGGILSSARLGIWSLHHGDNDVNRGGPPAFWEVVNNEHLTGVTLLRISENLDGGTILGKSFSKTDHTSFHRNQTSVYWAGIELFCDKLNRLSRDGEQLLKEKEKKSFVGFYSAPLYRNPRNAKALKIFLSFWLRRIDELLTETFSEQQWSLYYSRRRDSFETSLFRYKNLKPPKGTDWADPFVFSADDSTYIFFEEFIRKDKKAHISMLEINNRGQLVSPKPLKVLDEPYHLSYPFIIQVADVLYMIPESASSKKVSLYLCEKFPSKWIKKKDILEDVEFYDPTLFHHERMWYLFGTVKPWQGCSSNQYLSIYYTDDLVNGVWKPHPLNPLTRDVRGSRPAGRIFNYNGKIVRPAQIGAPKYGYGIRFNQIIKLTPSEFIETPIEDILPLWQTGLLATHTFNFDNKFVVVDAQKRRT